MVDFIREVFFRFKKGIIFGTVFICIISVFIITKVNVKAGNSNSISYSDKRFTNYTIVEGDTLWDIAEDNIDYDYYKNVYEYMNELRYMNNLKSDNIYVGQNLLITYYVNK